MVKFVAALYKAYVGSDASLFEINPVIKAADGKVYAADAKVTIDNNALYRHKDIACNARSFGGRSIGSGSQPF